MRPLGTGAVTLSNPTLPDDLGPLGVAASITVALIFSVPTTVTKFSILERGILQDGAGNSHKFVLKQPVTRSKLARCEAVILNIGSILFLLDLCDGPILKDRN